MNDVTDNINYSMIRLFADDITIYREIEPTNDAELLRKDLKALQHWGQVWLLNFNISKCHVSRISRAVKHKVNFDYKLHDTPLSTVDNCKYLGISIQSDLKWSAHIHNIVVKASHTLFTFKKKSQICKSIFKRNCLLYISTSYTTKY